MVNRSMNKKVEGKLKKIKMLILDVDGVMTDGKIIMDSDGREMKTSTFATVTAW